MRLIISLIIDSLLSPEPVTRDSINKLYTTYVCLGPVPRTCMKKIDVTSEQGYNNSVESYINEIDRQIAAFIAHGGRETFARTIDSNASHCMAIMDPSDTGRAYTSRIITRWVSYRLYEKAQEHSQHDCFMLFKHLSRIPTLRSSAGWFFKSYVHNWFLQGGTFQADQIPIVDNRIRRIKFKTIKSTSYSNNFFTTASHLADLVKGSSGRGIDSRVLQTYFLPYGRNYPSVDGLMFYNLKTLMVFQITIAERHEIKSVGVAELLKALPKAIENIYCVFVVPQERADHYSRAQLIPDKESIAPPREKLSFKQFRLVFSDESMQQVVGHGM